MAFSLFDNMVNEYPHLICQKVETLENLLGTTSYQHDEVLTIILGIKEGYNECCIKNFVNINRLGYPAAAFMFFVLNHRYSGKHVLCPKCYALHKTLHPHDNPDTFGNVFTREDFLSFYNISL